MPKDIRIRKGFNIKLKGAAARLVSDASKAKIFAIKPADFHGLTPRMVKKQGETVKAGEVIFFSKKEDRIKFVSPVSGVLKEIKRGAKRRILEVKIEAAPKQDQLEFPKTTIDKLSSEQVKQRLLESGCWPFIKQRPYDVIANPNESPKAIFVSACASAPLAADVAFTLQGKEQDFQAGIDALRKLTEGKVHLSVHQKESGFLQKTKNVELHKLKGPHPIGNVGVQIHHIAPINAGERVWAVGPQDVAIIGKVFTQGVFDASRIVAVGGTSIKNPKYYKTIIGTPIAALISEAGVENPQNTRMISGDVLTGTAVSPDGYLGYYDNTFTAIPEGSTYRMFGWLPFLGNNIPSMSKTSLSFLSSKPKTVNTNLNGEARALVVTGEMEKVMPMDILPMQLLKECMAGNIEKMENLGIYEVAPEDFALIDYTNTSKLEAQAIIRQGLDLMIQEVG